MKKSILFVVVFMLLICTCCENKQKLTENIITSSPLNWGSSFIGDTIETKISCINLNNKQVAIDYIRTSCGCIIAIPRKAVINGKDSTVIDIRYFPRGIGYTEEHLFMYLKNINTPILLTIKGKIKQR